MPKKNDTTTQIVPIINEIALFNDVSEIIERRKFRAQVLINKENVLMFWEVGKHIGSVLLGGERAEYGKKIVVTLAQQLQVKYGSSFDYTNVTRMIKFAARFSDFEILVPLAQQFIIIIYCGSVFYSAYYERTIFSENYNCGYVCIVCIGM